MGKYLLLDRRFLNPQGMVNVSLEPTSPVKDEQNNPLFVQDKPWEIRIDNGYPNVLYDEQTGIFHCYYTLFTEDYDTEGTTVEERTSRDYRPRMDRVICLAYARSKDGVHWEKPSLGLVDWRGSRENNLLFQYAHGTGVMIDDREEDPGRRFKMVTKVDIPNHGAHMAVAFSADGVHWSELTPWPDHNPTADSHNLPFWNEKEKCYMLLSRIWKDGVRITTICRSMDFIHWSEPKETLRGQGFGSQIYSMPAFANNNIYLGLASVIHEGDRLEEDFDCVDCELTWSADGEKFDFVAPGKPVIKRGCGRYPDGDFDNSCIYASQPVENPDGSLWVYYMGGNGRHTNFRESSLGRAYWEADKFAAYVPKNLDRDCTLTTSTLEFREPYLELLASPVDPERRVSLTASVHSIWTEEALEGFSMEDSRVTFENGWYRIRWAEDCLSQKKGCMRIKFSNLKIWAVQGGFELCGHRLWEGADLENEGQ